MHLCGGLIVSFFKYVVTKDSFLNEYSVTTLFGNSNCKCSFDQLSDKVVSILTFSINRVS